MQKKNMKAILIITIGLITLAQQLGAQTDQEMKKEIETLIMDFESAVSQRNLDALETILHKQYRVVANRFKGSPTPTVIDRKSYLEMMKAEKIGGVEYQVDIKSISTFEHTASAELLFQSNVNPDLHKYLLFVLDQDDVWKVVSDVPVVTN